MVCGTQLAANCQRDVPDLLRTLILERLKRLHNRVVVEVFAPDCILHKGSEILGTYMYGKCNSQIGKTLPPHYHDSSGGKTRNQGVNASFQGHRG